MALDYRDENVTDNLFFFFIAPAFYLMKNCIPKTTADPRVSKSKMIVVMS